jgi:CubicO group peptidase (beta-lactamase class C family)
MAYRTTSKINPGFLVACILFVLVHAGGLANSMIHPDSILAKLNLVGFSLVAVKGGEVVYSEHRGLANISEGREINSKTMFRVASVSKTVTSMAFMILEQEGLAGLDDDLSDILGYKIENPHHPGMAITPRMLMSHTSGLTDGGNYMSFLLNETYENPAPPSIKELVCADGSWFSMDQWNESFPGSYFSYSNLGYGLLGTVIEKVSDQRFDLFVKNRILDPLKIEGGFNIREISNLQGLAVLYRNPGDIWEPQADHYPGDTITWIDFSGYTPGTNALLFGPQGGLRISAEDLAKIMILLLNQGMYEGHQILSPSSVRKMQEVQWKYNGTNGNNNSNLFNSWGLGLFISSMQENGDVIIPGFRMTGHAGQAYGLLSGMYFCPESDFGIIFILNGKAGPFVPGKRSSLFHEEEVLIDYLFQNAINPLAGQ